MKYSRITKNEELKELIKNTSFDEVQILKDTDIKDGGENVFLITKEGDADGKNIVIAYGNGEIGEYDNNEAKEYVLGEQGHFDLYFTEGITKIRPYAFSGLKIKHCLIPESMEEIGECAFKDCEELESIIIAKCVKYIRKSAFEGCESLKKIVLPSTIEVVEEKTFYGCGDMQITIDKPEGSLTGMPWDSCYTEIIWSGSEKNITSESGGKILKMGE